MKLGQPVLDLIEGSLWDRKSWGMEDITLGFAIFLDQDRAFPYYL